MPRRLHRVEFSWFETKTYPMPLTLTRAQRETFPVAPKQPDREQSTTLNSNRTTDGGYLDRLGGENPRRNENIALEPRSFVFFSLSLVWFTTVSGRESYVCTRCSRNREVLGHTDTNTQQAITSISMTSHWPTPLRFMLDACSRMTTVMWACVCVCEQSDRVSSECDENFQFQNGDRRFFATCVFGFFGRWEYVSRWRLRQSLAP